MKGKGRCVPYKSEHCHQNGLFCIVCEWEAEGHRTRDLGLSSATSTGNQHELVRCQRSLNSNFLMVPQGSCKAFRAYSTSNLLCKVLELRKLRRDLCWRKQMVLDRAPVFKGSHCCETLFLHCIYVLLPLINRGDWPIAQQEEIWWESWTRRTLGRREESEELREAKRKQEMSMPFAGRRYHQVAEGR